MELSETESSYSVLKILEKRSIICCCCCFPIITTPKSNVVSTVVKKNKLVYMLYVLFLEN